MTRTGIRNLSLMYTIVPAATLDMWTAAARTEMAIIGQTGWVLQMIFGF
jgi:hypothetical protein